MSDPRSTVSSITDAEFIRDLYTVLLERVPSEGEERDWAAAARNGLPDREIVRRFINSSEYKFRHRITPGHPIGHYHSPIIDPEEARRFMPDRRGLPPDKIDGVDISLERMRDLWSHLAPIIATRQLPRHRDPAFRFYWDNRIFPVGDAAILRGMMGHFRPARIVEIGSGFSSACMLDAVDEFQLSTTLTLIEPFPERLQSLLREGDERHVRLIKAPVQTVDLALFDELDAGDFLFIDSSHVLKAGSDVNFELFDILPRLKPGVIVHFHDIHYPFELPAKWIYEERYSWNEVYAVRAFLMYSEAFKIIFFNDLFPRFNRKLVEETYKDMLLNPGASLWIEKTHADQKSVGIEKTSGMEKTRA